MPSTLGFVGKPALLGLGFAKLAGLELQGFTSTSSALESQACTAPGFHPFQLLHDMPVFRILMVPPLLPIHFSDQLCVSQATVC